MASVGAALIAQMTEIELSVAGLAGVVLTLVIRLRTSDPDQKQNHPVSSSPPFEALRDTDISDRNDSRTFPEYRKIFAESQRQWETGALATDADRTTAKNSALDFTLNAEARRSSHAEKAPVTLVVVKDTGKKFIIKRVAPPSFGNGIRPGMECHHDTSLAQLASRYAPHHYDAEFPAFGETYHLVALAEQPISPTAEGLVEEAATHYQLQYTYFRMAGLAAPPPPVQEAE
jgi:hypothetical protein